MLAVMLMLGVLMRDAAVIGVVLMSLAMHMRGGGRRHFRRQAPRVVAERQRNARRKHAKQIQQGGKPPRLGAHGPRQANEHGGKLTPAADFAKATLSLRAKLSVIPGRCDSIEPGISRSRVHAARAPE